MDTELKKYLKTTKKYLTILENNNIKTIKDLLQYFPRTYEDRSKIFLLHEIPAETDGIIMVKGKIEAKKFFMRGGRKLYEITFTDSSGAKGYITIFNSPYLAQKIELQKWYMIIGKPRIGYGKITFTQPETVPTQAPDETSKIDSEYDYATNRIYPIYSELSGIKPGWFAKKIWTVMDKIQENFKEYLPTEFLKNFGLVDIHNTIKNIHYPDTIEAKNKAIYRVFFDRLLRIQLFSLLNKDAYQAGRIEQQKLEINRNIVKEFVKKLPFELTKAQKKVTKHIIENIHEPKAMMRLLQGDVGSGKTVVAATVAYYIHKYFKGQTVFLAPLEVLANQHFKSLAKLFLPLGLRMELLTGSVSKEQKEKIKQDLKDGKIHILVGTHAVLQEDVQFHNLQLAVIDEQHKFGVRQRAFFKKFGSPHILQMSATPIPRSMALAFFGEFTVSLIDELPAGRKPIYTKIISEKEYHKLKPRILDRVQQNQKVFIVTPLIEESEKMEELKAATGEYQEAQHLFPELKGKIGLLHGKMKPKEKEEMMQKFKDGKIMILVSTTVIEVGVDIPEATVMIIKNAERFGLSQLHQLRGRIGRNDMQSYCFLETPKKSGETYKRLKAMEETNDGFKLAELDLQNRGAGEILGTLQSGETDIPLEILSDIKFLEKIQDAAKWLLEKYPKLEGLDNLKEYLDEKIGDILA